MEAAKPTTRPVEAPAVRALAVRRRDLVHRFTGADPGIAAWRGHMCAGGRRRRFGRPGPPSNELMAYARRAVGALTDADAGTGMDA